ncbi:LPS assembly lipoprotein LptE [Xanthomonas sacchari]|uniref:LPS-assembly lipoprotein LptE n=1 Tax=Xanthomonas sacchari TaxID=56458 RepID=UPI00225AF10D|nr:LPS assembly lipoprotein LptE [Xanthomonas sacchari]MCW0450981.1 LPS-assembly lipoprotein LptE [Xanthomonas sacchari]
MTRLLLALVFAASLTACGFHLRNKLTLPADTPSVKVVSSAPYSELAKLLERGLRAAGAQIAPKDVNTGVARLEVLSERWGDLPIALDAEGRAQEYSLRYAAIFLFRRADGSVLVPQQVIELSRDYVSPPTDATGTSTEREILADELRREMSASMLRRIDSVVRAQVRDGKDVNAAPASTDGMPVEGKPADGTPAAGKPATTPQP